MGQAPGIITEILNKVNYCEFCDRPSDSVNVCDIYLLDKFDAKGPTDLSKSIIVLCPTCKNGYDQGAFNRKHLKACVMLRDPRLSVWLNDLFAQYDIRLKQDPVRKTPIDSSPVEIGKVVNAFDGLVGNQIWLDGFVFLLGIIVVIVGIILFSYGYNSVSNYESDQSAQALSDPGQGSSGYLFRLFLEVAGVIIAFAGLFFVMGTVKDYKKFVH